MLDQPAKKRRGKSAPMSTDDFRDSNTSVDDLRSVVQRLEQRGQDKQDAADDITEIYSESKSRGFDVKALRQLIRWRKTDPDKADTEEALLDTYKNACGRD